MPDFNGRGGKLWKSWGLPGSRPSEWECHAEPVPGSPGHKGREGGRAMGRLNQVRTKPWPQSRASSPSSSSRNYLFSKTQQKVALAQSQAKSFQVWTVRRWPGLLTDTRPKFGAAVFPGHLAKAEWHPDTTRGIHDVHTINGSCLM